MILLGLDVWPFLPKRSFMQHNEAVTYGGWLGPWLQDIMVISQYRAGMTVRYFLGVMCGFKSE